MSFKNNVLITIKKFIINYNEIYVHVNIKTYTGKARDTCLLIKTKISINLKVIKREYRTML